MEKYSTLNSSLFPKPAHNGLTTPWHQDGEYWPIRPLETCTVWLAIDDATTENGCLQYMPGSHLQQELRQHQTDNTSEYTLNQEITADAYDEDKAFNLEIKAGQIALHDVYIVHGSKQINHLIQKINDNEIHANFFCFDRVNCRYA